MKVDPNLDLYKTLGVDARASPEEIKKAYRRLAKRYHPDTTGGDKCKEAKFKEISLAYDILADPDKRAQYDALRANPAPRFHGFPGNASGFGDLGGLGDLFAQFFAGATGPGHVRYRTYTAGAAGEPFADSTEPFAPGVGNRRRRAESAYRREPEPSVRAADGTPLSRQGNDVISEVRLSVDQAMLGTVAEVSTLTGRAKVKIPPGTSSGKKLRLKGRGVGGRGDHYVTVHVDVPRVVDKKAQRLLVQLMEQLREANKK